MQMENLLLRLIYLRATRKIPELQNLIEKYYKDVRGLKKAEIEGSEFTDPNTGKTRKTEGKKPIDDEFETLYTVEDQKNPNVVDKLNTGGIYKTNPQTGEIEKTHSVIRSA